MPVVADEDDGAGEVVEGRDQRLARLDVEMVGGLVENEERRRLMRNEREGESRLLAAREFARACECVIRAETEAGEMGAHALGGRPRHQPREMVESARLGLELLDLMLREKAAAELRRTRLVTRHRREPSGDEPRQRGLAVAIGAQKGDTVLGIEAEIDPPQHRAFWRVADGDLVQGEERRREGAGIGKMKLHGRLALGERYRLELGQALQPALRLARLARLGAEAVDEGLEVLALGLLLGGKGLLARQRLAPGAQEGLVAAAVERKPPLAQMQHVIGDIVDELPVMAHQDEGAAIAA